MLIWLSVIFSAILEVQLKMLIIFNDKKKSDLKSVGSELSANLIKMQFGDLCTPSTQAECCPLKHSVDQK